MSDTAQNPAPFSRAAGIVKSPVMLIQPFLRFFRDLLPPEGPETREDSFPGDQGGNNNDDYFPVLTHKSLIKGHSYYKSYLKNNQ
jgi:hypothetical protein